MSTALAQLTETTVTEPVMRTVYLPMSLDAARKTLKPEIPIFPEGTLKIRTKKGNVSIGYNADDKERRYHRYRVSSPLLTEAVKTANWPTALACALDLAEILDKSKARKAKALCDNAALAYEEFVKVAEKAGMTPTELHLLTTQVGQALGEKLKETLRSLVHGADLIKKSETPVSDLIRLGATLQNIRQLHPYLTELQMMAAIEQLFPTAMPATTIEILQELAVAREFTTTSDSMKRYQTLAALIMNHTKRTLRETTPDDISNIAESFVDRTGKTGITVKKAGRDAFVTYAKALFNFMIEYGHYPKTLGNPVRETLISRKSQTPKEECILTPDELHRWIEAAPWYCIPYIILAADGGIRPDTIYWLPWEAVCFGDRVIRVPAWASKTYKGVYPHLSDAGWELLKPWEGCIGAVIPYENIPEQAREAAIKAGIRTHFQDDARKSAITYRAAMVREKTGAQEILNLWCGNSSLVRRLFYECFRTLEQAEKYFNYSRVFGIQSVTLQFARQYLRSQVQGQARLLMKQKYFRSELTHRSTVEQQAAAYELCVDQALALFANGVDFPDFLSVAGNALPGPINLPRRTFKSKVWMTEKTATYLNEMIPGEQMDLQFPL